MALSGVPVGIRGICSFHTPIAPRSAGGLAIRSPHTAVVARVTAGFANAAMKVECRSRTNWLLAGEGSRGPTERSCRE
jgi:hypothetical protein